MGRLARWFLLAVAVGLAGAVLGAEPDWRLSAGLAWRQFGDVDFSGFPFRNFANVAVPGGPFGIQNYSNLPGLVDGSGVTMDYVRCGGHSESLDGPWAPVLTIERVLGRTAEVEFSLASSLQYYSVSARAGAAGGLDAHHYNYVVVNQAVLAPPIGGPFDGLSPGTAAVSGTRKLAMDLYVFDLGGKAALATGWFSLSCAAGPALYLSDAESRHNESGTWNLIPGTGDPGSYRLAERDSAQRACIGAFISLGAGVRLTDSLALAVEYRYDAVDRTAGTSSAAVDLDGQSCMLELVYSF